MRNLCTSAVEFMNLQIVVKIKLVLTSLSSLVTDRIQGMATTGLLRTLGVSEFDFVYPFELKKKIYLKGTLGAYSELEKSDEESTPAVWQRTRFR